MDALVSAGVRLDRHYTYKVCSPTRSSFQSGRLPVHVNTDNADPAVYNPADPVSGFAGIPRNSKPPRRAVVSPTAPWYLVLAHASTCTPRRPRF